MVAFLFAQICKRWLDSLYFSLTCSLIILHISIIDMKLFLLDAYALIYRSYYAFIKNPRVNSKGQNVSAAYGFTNTLQEILNKENPTHIAVAFDPPGKTFRHETYEQYKAQRQETPEDIRNAVPIIKNIIEAYNIKVLEVPFYEADDVIGTVSKQAERVGFDVYMVTPDKDYGQLTSKHIFMYKPRFGDSGFDILDDKDVLAKYGLTSPMQIIDYLGLMGDASDNIPGCPGVGPKTAQKLLDEFGTIENLLENTDKLKGSIKNKIEENKEQITFSKYLATIKTDVPINFEKEELKYVGFDAEKLENLFEELEFRSLIDRILKKDTRVTAPPVKKLSGQLNLFGMPDEDVNEQQANTADTNYSNLKELKDVPHSYFCIDNEEEIRQLIEKLSQQPFFSFDTETTGIDPVQSKVVGISFSMKEGEAFYIPVPPNFEEARKRVQLFYGILADEKIEKIGQNIKYDIIVLKKYGIEVNGSIFDTMIAHYILNPELRHGMDYMAETYLNYKTIHIDELIGKKGKNQLNMRDLAPQDIYNYACEDADVTLQLKHILEKEINEKPAEKMLLYDIEFPLVHVLADMEYVGVKLDKNALEESSLVLTKEMQEIKSDIYKLAKAEFNINSAKQVGEVLFDKLKIVDKPKKTKTGHYATGEETLEKLRTAHPIVGRILEYRGLKKLLSTYIDALPALTDKDSKLHTSFNQTATSTGRLSSSNPNLQNIPIRGENGKEIRKAFVCEEGCTFFSSDYSQIELRIMAALSNDENMVSAFNSEEDIHASTAAKIYKIPLEDVSSDMRRKAKTANFGIIYGISVFGLSERLSISRAESKELIDGYFDTYPQVKAYMDKSIKTAQEKGYVETIFGRKRFLPDINSRNATVRGYAERNAINAPIQGSAADIIKVAMIRIYKRFKDENLKSKMILQVHDELNFNVYINETEKITQIVKDEMENAYKLSVSLKVEYGTGKNWLEAH